MIVTRARKATGFFQAFLTSGVYMRILHIAAANMLTGGGERHVAELITWQKEQGHDCALIAPGGGDLGELAHKLGLSVYEAKIARGFSLDALNAVMDGIIDFEPEIVHVHGHRAALFGRLADSLAGKRLVYTLHGIHIGQGLASFAKIAIERLYHKRVARFIVTAKSDIQKAEMFGIARADEIDLVYNGIPLRSDEEIARIKGAFRAKLSERGVSENTALILHVGRLDVQKDQQTLIKAASLIRAEKDWHLAMICPGSSDSHAKYQALIDEYGVSDRLTLFSALGDISAAYVDADIFTLSSLWEGTPYSLLEAMQAENAIVATEVSGIPEAIEHEVSGLLFGPRDAEKQAELLARVIDDVVLREEFAARARETALKRYTLDHMARSIQKVYERVLEKSDLSS